MHMQQRGITCSRSLTAGGCWGLVALQHQAGSTAHTAKGTGNSRPGKGVKDKDQAQRTGAKRTRDRLKTAQDGPGLRQRANNRQTSKATELQLRAGEDKQAPASCAQAANKSGLSTTAANPKDAQAQFRSRQAQLRWAQRTANYKSAPPAAWGRHAPNGLQQLEARLHA